MIVYVNQNGEIHDVGTTTDETLSPVEIIDDDENPFTGWSDARICCYRVQVYDGHVVMMTPFVSSILIDFVDRFGTADAQTAEDIIAAEQEITDQDLSMMEAEQEITDLDLRLMELENAQEGANDEA